MGYSPCDFMEFFLNKRKLLFIYCLLLKFTSTSNVCSLQTNKLGTKPILTKMSEIILSDFKKSK